MVTPFLDGTSHWSNPLYFGGSVFKCQGHPLHPNKKPQVTPGISVLPSHTRRKYGIAISATPMMSSQATPLTKYGNTISATPHTSGTMARCFLP